MDLKMPTVILVTKLERFPKGEEAIAEVADEYFGSVGFVIVDVNFVDTATIPSLRIDASFRQSDIPFLVMHPGRSENAEFFQMNDDITGENLSKFIDNVLGENVPDYEDNDVVYDDKDVSIEDIQDDPVQEATFHERVEVLDITNAQELTDKTFPEFIARKDLTAILFLVEWDPRCQAFLKPFTLAAKEVMELTGFKESALAQVNCFDWPDVCKKANVTRYPMIKLYRGTNEVVEYGGVLDEASFLKFYLL
ncbi:thioredoxin domain-containing protein 16-like [Anneissia japonica]|uniref:thioredoxin domain-containing protein 16-like n=1 Tax=Anneissia japonica TaxID=1529436 RepID=UPI00142560CA|nr:thioredoxin domain-containing protein 16-like [Anneissia japonica]